MQISPKGTYGPFAWQTYYLTRERSYHLLGTYYVPREYGGFLIDRRKLKMYLNFYTKCKMQNATS